MMDFSVINESGTALDAVSPAVIKVIGCGGDFGESWLI